MSTDMTYQEHNAYRLGYAEGMQAAAKKANFGLESSQISDYLSDQVITPEEWRLLEGMVEKLKPHIEQYQDMKSEDEMDWVDDSQLNSGDDASYDY